MSPKHNILQHIINKNKTPKKANYIYGDRSKWNEFKEKYKINKIYLTRYDTDLQILKQTGRYHSIVYKNISFYYDDIDSEMFPTDNIKAHKFIIVLHCLLNKQK